MLQATTPGSTRDGIVQRVVDKFEGNLGWSTHLNKIANAAMTEIGRYDSEELERLSEGALVSLQDVTNGPFNLPVWKVMVSHHPLFAPALLAISADVILRLADEGRLARELVCPSGQSLVQLLRERVSRVA